MPRIINVKSGSRDSPLYTLTLQGKVGSGTVGVIDRYTCARNGERCAAKCITKPCQPNEDRVTTLLQDSDRADCCTIRVKRVRSPGNLYAMEPMDGDLFEFAQTYIADEETRFGKLTIRDKLPMILRILTTVQQQLMCLVRHDLLYTDVKLENILYRVRRIVPYSSRRSR